MHTKFSSGNLMGRDYLGCSARTGGYG